MEPSRSLRATTARRGGEPLSDSISVDLTSTCRVTRTLSETSRAISFAAGGNRAFITIAHGQQRSDARWSATPGAGSPLLTSASVPRADVWVWDATNLGSAYGGLPIRILSFFADTPRALATDGTTVYVAAFLSGNQTTAINEKAVCDGFTTAGTCTTPGGATAPGGLPGPSTNAAGAPAPETGLIVVRPADRRWPMLLRLGRRRPVHAARSRRLRGERRHVRDRVARSVRSRVRPCSTWW
jgi:hypothetical protein